MTRGRYRSIMKDHPFLLHSARLFLLAAFSLTAPSLYAFDPGSDSIDEADILDRIESEVGLKKKEQQEGNTAAGRPDKDGQSIVVSSESGTVIEGTVRLNQQSIKIKTTEQSGEGRGLTISSIQSIEITAWKSLYAKKESEHKYTVLMIPCKAIIRLRSGESVQGEIEGEHWIQLVIKVKEDTRLIRLSFTVSVEADSVSDALEKASASKPDHTLFASLKFPKKERQNELSSSVP